MQLENTKCRNCGGELEYSAAVNGVITCPFCGSKFMLPKSGASEQVRSFLLMGEHELDVGHFDDAANAYMKAAELDPKEPEAFFGLALANAQVQYLKDYIETDEYPHGRLQPICYSVTDKMLTADSNYKRAISLATSEQKKEYERRAAEIDYIRQKFREFKQDGMNYDCFICVKVREIGSDKYTQDSVIASKLYREIKNAGFSPFYSEEEIYNKQGAEYEAMILYALYSSQSMFIVCSDENYLQTQWVKNEYTRFLKMQRDEDKARGSLTVVFKGAPIDRIPGMEGKIQGIDFNSFNALNLVLDFVQKFKKVDVPTIKRKEYGQAKVNKISATRKGVEKRQLSSVAGGTVSISDKAKLNVVVQCLQRSDFVNAKSLVNKIISENPANGQAYFLRFLADAGFKDEVAFVSKKNSVNSYDDFEKALSAAAPDGRKKLYDLLFQRTLNLKKVEDYSEFIALPDSTSQDIGELTDVMYAIAKEKRDPVIFDCLINTVTDTKKYILMNLQFMNLIPVSRSDYDRQLKRKYCENILSVDNANEQALWYKFVDGHPDCLNADKAVIEESLFSYGYNKFAMDNLMQICLANAGRKESDELFDFLLAMVPQDRNAEYIDNLNKYIEALFAKQNKAVFASIEKYNALLLAADAKCDMAYLNRVIIKNGFKNPIELMTIADTLMADEDYSTAIMLYAEKYPDYKNLYMDIIDELKRADKKLSSSVNWRRHVLNDVYIRREDLAKCASKVNNPAAEKTNRASSEAAATKSGPSSRLGNSATNSAGGNHRSSNPQTGAKILTILGYLSLAVFIVVFIIQMSITGDEAIAGAMVFAVLASGICGFRIRKLKKNHEYGKVIKYAVIMLVINIVLILACICIPMGILVD